MADFSDTFLHIYQATWYLILSSDHEQRGFSINIVSIFVFLIWAFGQSLPRSFNGSRNSPTGNQYKLQNSVSEIPYFSFNSDHYEPGIIIYFKVYADRDYQIFLIGHDSQTYQAKLIV